MLPYRVNLKSLIGRIIKVKHRTIECHTNHGRLVRLMDDHIVIRHESRVNSDVRIYYSNIHRIEIVPEIIFERLDDVIAREVARITGMEDYGDEVAVDVEGRTLTVETYIKNHYTPTVGGTHDQGGREEMEVLDSRDVEVVITEYDENGYLKDHEANAWAVEDILRDVNYR